MKISISGKKILLNIILTPTQYELLRLLAKNINEIVFSEQMNDLFNPRYKDIESKRSFNVRPHINYIRRALKGTGFEVLNIRGRGYKLADDNCKEM